MKNKLLDGRRFWTTNNGFTFWLQDATKRTIEVSQDYYSSLTSRLRLEKSKKFKRKNKQL